jgi:hypothetical protein
MHQPALEERRAREAEEATRERKWKMQFKALGLRKGQSQAEVKSILLAHGFKSVISPENARRLGEPPAPWHCEGRSADDNIEALCASKDQDSNDLIVTFIMFRRYRDPDTGRAHQVRIDRLIDVFYLGSDIKATISDLR